jgi:hypothetical protein
VVVIFQRRRPSLEGDPDLLSQPSRIDQVRIGRSRRESGLPPRTTKTGGCRIPPGGTAQQSERVIRTTFRNIMSKGGGTSSEARLEWIRIPPGFHPVFPAAIPPIHYSDIRIDGVSFPLPPGLFPHIRNPNLLRCCSSPFDGSIRLVVPLALLNSG